MVLVVSAALAAPAPAGAYAIGGLPWPGARVTYHVVPRSYADAVRRAARVWNRAHVGVSLRRASSSHADVIVSARGGFCGGEAPMGFLDLTRSWIRLGPCNRSLMVLVAAHEFGHVLGLDHERRRCALMNPVRDGSGTPDRCHHHSLRWWLRHPLTRDDRRGARRLYGG